MQKVTAVLTMAMLGVGIVGQGTLRADTNAIRSSGPGSVSFRLATTTPTRGYEKMTVGGSEVFVAPRALLSGSEILATESIDARSGTDLELSVSAKVVAQIENSMRQHGIDRLAVVVNGKVLATGTVELDAENGRVTLFGLESISAARITAVLNGRPIQSFGSNITLVPSATLIAAGGSVNIDVFATNVRDLHVYQVTLTVSGGVAGEMTTTDLLVDSTRSDFVFAGKQKLEAVDTLGGRLGAVMFHGGIDIPGQAYLGTYTLTASADASGSFTVTVSTVSNGSFMKDSKSEIIRFSTGTGATFSVGTPSRRSIGK